jgi:hypothetical protein
MITINYDDGRVSIKRYQEIKEWLRDRYFMEVDIEEQARKYGNIPDFQEYDIFYTASKDRMESVINRFNLDLGNISTFQWVKSTRFGYYIIETSHFDIDLTLPKGHRIKHLHQIFIHIPDDVIAVECKLVWMDRIDEQI